MTRTMDTKERPVPDRPPPATLSLDHAAGESVRDERDRFAEITRQQSLDKGAQRAFLLAKLELVKNDHRMCDSEKQAAIRELEAILDSTDSPGQA
jgi:hypothetical protein